MTLNTGITVNLASTDSVFLGQDLPIAVLGSCSTGTLATNTLARISSSSQAESLLGGGTETDTLPKTVKLLQRQGYNCGNLLVMKVENEAGLTTGLASLSTALATVGESPNIIIFPEFNSAAVVQAAIDICEKIRAIALVDINAATMVSDAIAARDGSMGVGVKHSRVIVCYPHLQHSEDNTVLEPLSPHLAGVLANLETKGHSPLNKPVYEVSGTEIPMTLSLSDETADNEKLTDAGITTVNIDPEGNYVIWGARNSNYTENETDPLSFTNAVRIRDEVARKFLIRQSKMLGDPSDFATAELLTESYRQELSKMTRDGAIAGYKAIQIDEEKTDYAAQSIWHYVEFYPKLPAELIGVTLAMSLKRES